MGYKKHIILLFVVIGYFSCHTESEKLNPIESNLASLLDSIYLKHPNGVGFILHVEAPDKNISWSGAVGYSDRETNEPLDKDQPGQIASITKTFVSIAIFRLIEQNKLRLYQPINSVLPERSLKLLDKYGYPTDSITIGHLLSHRSGIPHNGTKNWYDKEENYPKYRWSRDELISDPISTLEKGKLGSFKYSDVNYYLLTEIIEELEETSFYLAIRELLKFKELGLQHTWFYTLEPYPQNTKKRFHQYRQSRNWISTFDESPNWGMWGGSGIVATAGDLAKFCQALATDKVFENPETLDMMFTQIGQEKPALNIGFEANDEQFAGQYRMGIMLIDGPGYKVFGHDGYWGSLMYHFPEQNMSIAFYGLNSDELLDFDKLFLDILNSVSN